MLQLAQEKGFDPVIPENWYQFDFQSVSKIVVYLPLPLPLSLSPSPPSLSPSPPSLSPSSLSPLPLSLCSRFIFCFCLQNMQFVDRLYQGNFSTALLSIFPDIGLERKRFDRQSMPFLFFSTLFLLAFLSLFLLLIFFLLLLFVHFFNRLIREDVRYTTATRVLQ